MLDRLVLHYQNPYDVRDLLRSFAQLPGQIDTTGGKVIVTLDPPDTPIHRRALHGLVDDLNRLGTTYPGTEIPVIYQIALHHSEAAALNPDVQMSEVVHGSRHPGYSLRHQLIGETRDEGSDQKLSPTTRQSRPSIPVVPCPECAVTRGRP